MVKHTTWVYLIYDPSTRFYKIGQSVDPEKRLRQFIRQDTLLPAAHRFRLVEAWQGTPEQERELHRWFRSSRVRGEWFDLPALALHMISRYFVYRNRYVAGSPEPDRVMEMELAFNECSGDYVDFVTEGFGEVIH
jgi:hypothetical protein